MNTAFAPSRSQLRALLLCADDASPLMGLRLAEECLEHLLSYYDLPEEAVLELQVCQAHIAQAQLRTRMAASRLSRG